MTMDIPACRKKSSGPRWKQGKRPWARAPDVHEVREKVKVKGNTEATTRDNFPA